MSQEASAPPRRVTVIGAGIVGACAALYLQRDGHQVTLIDRRGPGGGASYGNAGGIVLSACCPLAMPGVLRRVPGMLLDPHGPLVIRWRYLPRLAPWLLDLVRASRPARVETISRALTALLTHAETAWREVAGAAEANSLLRPAGWLKVYHTEAGFEATRPERDLMARRGRPFEVLGADELRQLEPALAPIFRHAIHQQEGMFVADPGRMVAALAARVAADGGAITTAEVRDVDVSGARPRVLTDQGEHESDAVVLAAGAWSRHLAHRLGARVRLDTERGYHLMLPPADPGLRRPTVWGEPSFALSPMEEGVRLASGVEFAGIEAPPDFARIRGLLPMAKRMLPSLELEERSAWLGFRPSTPDSLPVIGRSPYHPGVTMGYGHGHLGLTLGPVTGRLLADLVAGREPGIDLAPFRTDR